MRLEDDASKIVIQGLDEEQHDGHGSGNTFNGDVLDSSVAVSCRESGSQITASSTQVGKVIGR